MITGLKVHTDDSVLLIEHARESTRTVDFIAGLVAERHGVATQDWVLRDGGVAGRALHADLTLEQNHIGNDHNLYLVPAGAPIVQELDLQIIGPDGQVLQVEVKSSTKVSLLLMQIPRHFGLEVVDSRGKSVSWTLVVQSTGDLLNSDKTLAENGIMTRAHLLLQRAVLVPDLVVETVAPDGQTSSKELVPGTPVGKLIEALIAHFELPKTKHTGDEIDWFLTHEKSKSKLDSGKSLSENGVETGGRLVLEAPPGACAIFTVRAADKESHRFAVAGDTPVSEFIQTLVVFFRLQEEANDGRPHVWILGARDGQSLDPDKTLVRAGIKTGDALALLLTAPNLRLEVSAPGGGIRPLEKPRDFLTAALIAELIGTFGLSSKDAQQREVQWTIRSENADNQLDTSKSLEANGIVDGDKLALVPVPKPPPIWIWLAGLAVFALLSFGIYRFATRPKPGIEISPGSVTLSPGESVDFSAKRKNGSNASARWTISPAIGTISANGVYEAPAQVATAESLQVTATSLDDPSASAQAKVSLRATVVAQAINLSPATASVNPSGSVQFLIDSAIYTGADLTWSVPPEQGFITATGLYTAPASVATPGTVTVQVSRTTGAPGTAQATISLQASVPPLPPVAPKIVPQIATIGGSQQLPLTLRPQATSPVQWSISPAMGTISPNGLYTAPSVIVQPTKVTATASSPGAFTSTSTINLAPIVVGPITLVSDTNRTYVLRSSISNSKNANILWSISPQFGAISSTGVYTPPATVPSARTIQVTATSAADPTKSNHFDIALAATTPATSVKVEITPRAPTVSAGQREQFTANVSGSSNTTVTWSSSGVGGISPLGVYSAPANVSAESTVHIWATSNADSRQIATTIITVRPAVGYQGPKEGVVTWTGGAGRSQRITISNGNPQVSGAFPGVAIEATSSDPKVRIVTAPSESSGWKTVVVQTEANETKISIAWKVK
jgi:hypothetical protein